MSTVYPKISEQIEKTTTLSEHFVKHLSALHEVLSKRLSPDNEDRIKLSLPNFERGMSSLRPQNAIITDNATNGYLFLPLSLLRAKIDSTTFDNIITESKSKDDSSRVPT
jgi:hypothetical protein